MYGLDRTFSLSSVYTEMSVKSHVYVRSRCYYAVLFLDGNAAAYTSACPSLQCSEASCVSRDLLDSNCPPLEPQATILLTPLGRLAETFCTSR